MSYSLSVKGDTKAQARENAEEKFDTQVVANQPVHVQDKAAALANLDTSLAMIAEPQPHEEVNVTMHGSISVDGATAGRGVIGVGIGANVWLANKPAASS